MGDLKVWANGVIDWVVAESAEDARAVANEHTGGPGDDDDEIPAGDEWEAEPDDKVLSIHGDEGGTEEKTCAVWVAQNGRCFLCSTEY